MAVSTASEMPVNETLWLHDELRTDGLALDAVIVNALYPDRFSDDERELLERARSRSRSPLTSAALGAALSEHARARSQAEQHQRLRDALGADGPPLVTLPYLFAEEIGPGELEQLADALGEPAARRCRSRRLTQPWRTAAPADSAVSAAATATPQPQRRLSRSAHGRGPRPGPQPRLDRAVDEA